MTRKEKINYLINNYPEEYKKAKSQATNIVDNKYPIFCCCGKIATGLHTQSCRKFNEQVDREVILLLNKLLPQ